MSQLSHAEAYRLHQTNWAFLFLAATAFWIALLLTDIRIDVGSVLYCYGICLAVGSFTALRFWQTAPHYQHTTFAIAGCAQVVSTTVIFAPSTYLAATLNWPLQDSTLYSLDRALGLDWRAYLDFANAHPWLGPLLSFGYKMISWPLFAIPLILALCGHPLRLNQYALAFSLALAVTTIVSAFVPAVAAYAHLGLTPSDYPNLRPLADSEHLQDLQRLRDGTFQTLDIRAVKGIVTFPSFHAASCLLYTWALWPVKWMRPVALIANGLMLASTPIDGGHYFVDVFAGLALAAASIWVACRLGRELSKVSQISFTATAPVAPDAA